MVVKSQKRFPKIVEEAHREWLLIDLIALNYYNLL